MKLKASQDFHMGELFIKAGQIFEADKALAERLAVERLAGEFDPKAEAKAEKEKGDKDEK
ncbi:hypothetical protein KW797_02580 [Candidatus Parcubacteria bacterium]|nr:hypothetical protein [Candidatus Parcubacteria bacterium]